MDMIMGKIVSYIEQTLFRNPLSYFSAIAATQKQPALDVYQEVTTLLRYLTQEHHPKYGFGTVCCNIYDTAWVSMVAKKGTNGQKVWVFPECFQTILDTQYNDGGWEPEGGDFDRIAATLASTLALKIHLNEETDNQKKLDLNKQIFIAAEFLNKHLPQLQTAAATEVPIGAELWFPKILELLEREGISLESTSVLAWLLPIREKKLARFPIETLYRPVLTSVAHSLEAFIDIADFGKLRHLKSFGSMLASPSSTAAYLIYSPIWDEDAESYLRHVVSFGSGCQSGRVPTTFPTQIFELAWVAINILTNGLNSDDQINGMLGNIGTALQGILEEQGGLLGFAKGVCSDADDTAKVLTLLNLLGIQASPDPLIRQFESQDHFFTFSHERNPSVSTNSHVLITLLHMSQDNRYLSQIEKCVQYLCRAVWNSDGLIQDKWNISPHYPVMLICEGMVEYIRRCDSGVLTPPETPLRTRIPLLLYQIMIRVVQTQNGDGSWGPRKSLEETAYVILTIKRLLSLSFEIQLRERAVEAVERASRYLEDHYNESFSRERLWVDKTLYSIQTVSKSYILGALGAKIPEKIIKSNIFKLCDASEATIHKTAEFLSSLPSFANTPGWAIECFVREGYMFINELQRVNFFSQQDGLGDKFLLQIASCLVASNNKDCYFLSSNHLCMVLEITVATCHLDNFMDTYLMRSSALEICEIEQFIHGAFYNLETGRDLSGSDTSIILADTHATQDELHLCQDVQRVKYYLTDFMQFMLDDKDGNASEYDRLNLQNELKAALLAQIAHIKASKQLQANRKQPPNDSNTYRQLNNQTFYAWLRGSGSDNVLYPVILKYMICKMAYRKDDLFPTAQEKYLVEDFCRHSAAEVRLWNDLGGIGRDKKEGILNSVDFPELCWPSKNKKDNDEPAQKILSNIAKYENLHVRICLDELERCIRGPHRQSLISRLRMHQVLTDAWGEMYSMSIFSVAAGSS